MHRDEWLADAEIQTDDGAWWTLRYYVRETLSRQTKTSYGIKVEKYTITGELTESNSTPSLTGSYAEAAELAKRLARGSVTPCVLLELVDEIFSGPAVIDLTVGNPASKQPAGKNGFTSCKSADCKSADCKSDFAGSHMACAVV